MIHQYLLQLSDFSAVLELQMVVALGEANPVVCQSLDVSSRAALLCCFVYVLGDDDVFLIDALTCSSNGVTCSLSQTTSSPARNTSAGPGII